jgi:hypothetical protein
MLSAAVTRFAAVLAACAALAASGCTSCAGPGGSFADQIDNTVWSLRVLSGQSGDLEGLGRDLQWLFDPRPELDDLPQTFCVIGW